MISSVAKVSAVRVRSSSGKSVHHDRVRLCFTADDVLFSSELAMALLTKVGEPKSGIAFSR
jgi:hypothetical protein